MTHFLFINYSLWKNEILQLVRASILRYIPKFNYTSLNKARYYDDKSAFYSSLVIERITIVSKGDNHFVSISGYRTSPSERGVNPKKKVHFHKYGQLFMRDCNRASAAEMSTISWLERSVILPCRHSHCEYQYIADVAESIHDNPKQHSGRSFLIRSTELRGSSYRNSCFPECFFDMINYLYRTWIYIYKTQLYIQTEVTHNTHGLRARVTFN